MASDNSVGDITAGVTKGFLDWTEEKIKRSPALLQNRDIAFVEEPETIKIVLEQRRSPEWMLFQKYVKDSRLRILFQTGLTLRKIEKNKTKEKNLKEKILKKYDNEGLLISRFVQTGVFLKYFEHRLKVAKTTEQLSSDILATLNDLEKMTTFIQSRDNIDKEVEKIVIRINSNMPRTYIISANESVKYKGNQVVEKVKSRISGYTVESNKTELLDVYFFSKIK
jgi:hypothetical protein